eukprot:tig00001224_g7636.t1
MHHLALAGPPLVAGLALAFVIGYFAHSFFGGDITGDEAPPSSWTPGEEYKLVLCVRQDLKMTSGKIAAQCSHATLGAYKKGIKRGRANEIQSWEWSGQPKIAVRVQNEKEMLELERRARQAGIDTYIVCDAGRTQIKAGSRTVLAVGPAPKRAVDAVTGHLKLL